MKSLKEFLLFSLKVLMTFFDFSPRASFNSVAFGYDIPSITITVQKLKDTEKAILVLFEKSYKTWVPKSQIEKIIEEDTPEGVYLTITIPEWLYDIKFK